MAVALNYNALYGVAILLLATSACGRDLISDPEGGAIFTGEEQVQRSLTEVVVRPEEYARALRNPHKGFTNRGFAEGNEWATLAHSYIRWNEIEDDAADGIDKIQQWCDLEWQGVEQRNIKVIPRVYLHWDGDRKYWPADMDVDDYSSSQFKERVRRLIDRLGQVWDSDPRVAHVEMGLIGKWGEHHSPAPDEEMQQLLGAAFIRSFAQKQILVRHPWEFVDFNFGIYWDSWAHVNQNKHADGILSLGDAWQRRLIGGEVAYNWGDYQIQPGDSPTDTVSDVDHRSYLLETIRRLHCTQLRWVADYDRSDEEARVGGEEVQKALGYRFVIDEVRYSSRIDPGISLDLSFAVRNTGSAPFYYDWPLELALLDPQTREVVWKSVFPDIDIRSWLPGDQWDTQRREYAIGLETYRENGDFAIPEDLAPGVFILSLAVLDPAGMVPAVRFAIRNYYHGGYHPIGYIGIGHDVEDPYIQADNFDDPYNDDSLFYIR